MIKDIEEIKKCPACGEDDIIHNKKLSQVVCKSCGEIFEPLTPKDEEEFEKKFGI